MGARGAGRHDRVVRALEAVADRDLAGRQVDQGRRNEEGADPAGAFFVQLDAGLFDRRQAANARADDDAGPFAALIILRRPSGVAHGFVGRGDGVEDEIVDPPLILGRHDGVGIEGAFHVGAAAAPAVDPRHFAGDVAGIVAGVEGGDVPGAGLAGQERLPGDLDARTERGHKAEAGHDDAAGVGVRHGVFYSPAA